MSYRLIFLKYNFTVYIFKQKNLTFMKKVNGGNDKKN